MVCFFLFDLPFQSNHAQVVEDCNNALELNNRYVKALFRRAKAFEMMNEKLKCLEGMLNPRIRLMV